MLFLITRVTNFSLQTSAPVFVEPSVTFFHTFHSTISCQVICSVLMEKCNCTSVLGSKWTLQGANCNLPLCYNNVSFPSTEF
jgi:hypothetical protein